MSDKQRSKATIDATVPSVSGKKAGKSIAAINSTEHVSISQFSSDASVVAGQCASSSIVAAPVVKTLETTISSGSSSQTPNSSFKAPFPSIATSVAVSQRSSSDTSDEVSSVPCIKDDSPSPVASEPTAGAAFPCAVNTSDADTRAVVPLAAGDTQSSTRGDPSAEGAATVPPSTPSSAPRRSSRARRINSRFEFDEVDENIKKFVARIAAPDSHSILQSPELAFHSPAPPPPPPPASLPPKASAEQTGETKANAKRPPKKIVKRLQAVVEIEKCKKETIAALTSNKSKVFKKSKQDTSHNKAKSSSLEAFGSDSDDDLPLAHFSASNTPTAAVEKPVLTPIGSKSKILNSKGAGSLPSKYSIKTIHNPELSSTPISIVCIEDPEEEEEEEDVELAQSSKKKVKKKISNENIPAKKRKGGLTSTHSKMNGADGMKVSKKLASAKTSKVQKPPKKFELEKLKNKLNASQGSTGKLLKIVNLKVVPSSLPDLSSNNALRKFIEKTADNAVCDKIADRLEKASFAVPDQASADEPETEAQGSSQKVVSKAPPQPKTENVSSKYDDLKALLHAGEPPLSPEWLPKKYDRSGSLPIKGEHNPCNSSSLGTDASNIECSQNEKQGSSQNKSVSNVASVETSSAENKTSSDSSGLGLKTETDEIANPSKRPSSDLSLSNSKKVKHERNAEKVVSIAENNAKDSFFTNFVYKPATDSGKESLGCNLSLIKVDPCERKPDLAMIRDTRIQDESDEQEKEAKLHLSSILQNEKISESKKPCSLNQFPGIHPLSGSAKSTSKPTSVLRSRTESPSDVRFTKRIKMSPVDSKEDVKPDLLMTKIIEGTGVESKPVLPSFKPSTDCSSPETLRDDKRDSCASGDRAFKEEPKKLSNQLLSSPSPTDYPVRGHKTARDDTVEQIFENKHCDSHLQSKDKASNDELNSSLNVQKQSLCNDSENDVGYDRKSLSGGHVKKASSVEKYSSKHVRKGSPRNDRKDDQSFLVSSKDNFSSDGKDSSQNDEDSSRDDKKGSSRSERKDSSRNGKHSSSHKSSHSSRGEKYHSERSSSRSSNSSRNSDKKAEKSSHKPRHESSRSRDQKSSRKDSDGRRDYDPRDESEKNRRRRSDDRKRDHHEKRNKVTDTSETRVVEHLGTLKAPFKAEVCQDVIGTCERVHSHELKTDTTSLNVSAAVPLTCSKVDDDKLIVSGRLARTAHSSIRDEMNSTTEMHSSKPVAVIRQDSPCASSANQRADVKFNVQETRFDGTLSSSSAISEDCHGVSSPSRSHHTGIQMKAENSVDESKISSPSICSANASQVQYKASMNLPSSSTSGSESEVSLKETVTTPLEAKHTPATDAAAPPINIAALLNLCRANIPNATRSKFPLKHEGTDGETSPLTSLVAGTSLSAPIASAENVNTSAKPQGVLSSTDSLVELISPNYVSKEECKFSSPTGVSVTTSSLPKESNFAEGEDRTEKRLCELSEDEGDASVNLSSVSHQANAARGHLCVNLEDFRVEKKGCSQAKDDCDLKEGSTAGDAMSVGGNILAGISSPSVELKGSPLTSVEETPEEKEKRVEKERQITIEKELRNKTVVEERLKSFVHLSENLYLIDRKKSKQSKEVRRMVCDCFLTKEEISRGEKGCGEDCLNRLLMIECGWRCPLGEACLNRQFQRCHYGPIEVFNAEEKGCGVRATGDISPGTFIMEYVGEVFDQREFRRRRKDYGKDGTAHFYFMALRADQFIDATRKGNISRFVNHSCDPNAETQKWTVNGELRIGFFATKYIAVGEEINFDYRMERYGREPQKCYCGTAVCRGWLGEPPDEKTKEEKEEERRKLASTDKRKKDDKKHFDDELLEDVCELGRVGLRNKRDTLLLSRVMVRAETDAVRVQLLALLCAASTNTPCLRLFMDYHGLSLLWSWMADLNTALHHAPLKLQILKTLDILPITNRTQVSDSRVLEMVEKWSKQLPPPLTAASSASTDGTSDQSGALASDASKASDGCGFEETDESSQQSSDDNSKQSSDDVKQSAGENVKQASDDSKRSPDDNIKQMLSPDDNSSDSNSSAVKSKSTGASQAPTAEGASNPLFSRDEDAHLTKVQLEMVELALKLLERWQVLKEEFRIPKKQRVELMKEHEREVEAGYRRYLNTERGRRETRDSRYGRSSYDSRRSKLHALDSHDKNSWPNNDAISIMMNSEEFAGLSKEERREKFARKVAQVDEQRRVQEGMWSVHVERCARIGLDPYQSPIVDPSGQYYWDSSNSTWVPLTPETAYAAGMLSPAVAQQHGMAAAVAAGFCMPGVDQPLPYDPHTPPVLNGEVLPPLVITIKLPPHWHIARDQLNRVYFYHNRSRQTQWEIPTNETKTSIQISDSESESSSSSSDSEEEFSSDEDEGNDDEVALATSTSAAEDAEVAVEGKIIRRQRGRKKHSEALVQQRVISPIRELDREQARKERREAKERAKHEARKERHFLDQQQLVPNDEDMDDEVESNADDLLISRVVHHPGRDKVKTKSKERAATAIADNSERARKIKDLFRSRMATFIVSVLNPYRRADCKQGRINTTDDFKYLARKLTHFVMVKELKQLPSIEDLDCSESVKHKTKDFVRKYMAKYGTSFKRDPLDTKEY